MRRSSRRGGKSFLELFPQLFLVPLGLVTIGVLVYLFFVASAQDGRSVSEIIQDMQGAGERARWQDANLLAGRIRDREAAAGGKVYLESDETELLVHLLKKFPADRKTRRFVITALGRAGQPGQTLSVLIEILEAPGTSAEERAETLLALGRTRTPGAAAPLLEWLRGGLGTDDWELRVYGIQALTVLTKDLADVERGPFIEELSRHLGDSRREVSWNTAYFLAYYFKSPAGVGILRRLLDVQFLDMQSGVDRKFTSREKESWLKSAVQGLDALGEITDDELEEARRTARDRGWMDVHNEVNTIVNARRDQRTE